MASIPPQTHTAAATYTLPNHPHNYCSRRTLGLTVNGLAGFDSAPTFSADFIYWDFVSAANVERRSRR